MSSQLQRGELQIPPKRVFITFMCSLEIVVIRATLSFSIYLYYKCLSHTTYQIVNVFFTACAWSIYMCFPHSQFVKLFRTTVP